MMSGPRVAKKTQRGDLSLNDREVSLIRAIFAGGSSRAMVGLVDRIVAQHVPSATIGAEAKREATPGGEEQT